MRSKYEYETILIKGPQLGVFAEFPFESAREFGTRKAIKVKATFDGFMFRMSLLPHGNGTHWLHLKKEVRDAIGKEEGDTVRVCIEKDEDPPVPEIPDYLQWLLDDDPAMKKAFRRMPVSSRKFWFDHIAETKNDDTRVERINRFFEYLIRHYSGKMKP